jgi:uncharacterized membrane protein YkvA (DUF1232 family)
MRAKEADFYASLRNKIHNWAKTDEGETHKYLEYILAVPDFFYVLWHLMIDDRISTEFKMKIGLVIVYFISPIDLFPEAILGPVGYLDDIGLTAALLNTMMDDYGDIVREHWTKVSNADILEVIKDIIRNIDNLIGHGLWNKLRSRFGF